MNTTWTVELENKPRNLDRPEFHHPELVRKGDKWHNPAQGYKDFMTVDLVTKYVDPVSESIWYIITFKQDSYLKGLNIAEGLSIGTFYKGEINA